MASEEPATKRLRLGFEYNDEDVLAVNTIRVLAADTVSKANSGHPGAPIGMAPAAHVLHSRIINQFAGDSNWINRDRFCLSNGHASALLYSILHLTGYKVTMDDLKSFRQLGSITPGHPENHLTDGVELTTGPLGQGFSNAVGMSLASRYLASKFNKPGFPLIENNIFVFCGDGCLQEGLTSEAASFAGHQQLSNLIVIYDDNQITIDGRTDLSFTEDVPARFRAYGWHTLEVANGNEDLEAIEAAIRQAQSQDRPTIISLKTIIGYKAVNQDTHAVHGSPLKPDQLRAFKEAYGFNPDEFFVVSDGVYQQYKDTNQTRGKNAYNAWNAMLAKYAEAYPAEAAEFKRVVSGELPANLDDLVPTYDGDSPANATRSLGGAVESSIVEALPELIGGSADLTPSTKTDIKCKGGHDHQKDAHDGRYLRFGVREHAMFAIGNGISAFGGTIPFTSTFLMFIQYGLGAVRLAAMSHFRHIMILTHDSIGVGEDGPTHQPVEVLAQLRSTPNMVTFRPADGNEVAAAWLYGIRRKVGPVVLSLTRQKCPGLAGSSRKEACRGGYVVRRPAESPKVILIASGSEVGQSIGAAEILEKAGTPTQVVSLPCSDIFDNQDAEYRRSVLTPGIPVVMVEAGMNFGLERYSHHQIAMTNFGQSAPGGKIMEFFGFTPDRIAETVTKYLGTHTGDAIPLPIQSDGFNGAKYLAEFRK